VQVDVNIMNVENPRDVNPRRASVDIVDDGIAFRKRVSIPGFEDFGAVPRCTAFGNTVAVIDGRRPSVALIDSTNGTRTDLCFHHGSAICVCEHSGCLVTAGRDAVVNVFANVEAASPLFSIPLYRDEITCCAVNTGFGLISSGTRDCFLVLSSLERGSNVRAVDLDGCRPYKVLITEGWGFVVICATKLQDGNLEHSISVYSANGAFVKRAVLQDAVVAWTAWTSASGFDFLVIASEGGKIWACEAFFLDFTIVKGPKLGGHVVGMRYDPRELGLVLMSANAELVVVPFVGEGG
jgi:hypothetical protein